MGRDLASTHADAQRDVSSRASATRSLAVGGVRVDLPDAAPDERPAPPPPRVCASGAATSSVRRCPRTGARRLVIQTFPLQLPLPGDYAPALLGMCMGRRGPGHRDGQGVLPPAESEGLTPLPPGARALEGVRVGLRGALRAKVWPAPARGAKDRRGLSPLRHPRPRLRAHPLRGLWARAPARLLLQGARPLSLVSQEAPGRARKLRHDRGSRGRAAPAGRLHGPPPAEAPLPVRPVAPRQARPTPPTVSSPGSWERPWVDGTPFQAGSRPSRPSGACSTTTPTSTSFSPGAASPRTGPSFPPPRSLPRLSRSSSSTRS